MTTLYLIRHAEAEGNVFRRLQGQRNAFVTENGKKQIEALKKRFEDIPIHAVYASDLYRTCLTATAIYRPKGLKLHKEPRLRELYCGIWEDFPFGYCAHIDPDCNRAFSLSPKTWGVEGSEPFEVYTGRFLEAMTEIAQRHEGESVAIFSHGMVMRGVLQRLFFPEKDNLGHSENTAVTKLLYDGENYTLEYLNDASHIPYEISTLGKQHWWRGNGKKDFNMWYRDAEEADAPLLEALGCPMEAGVRISMLTDKATGVVLTRPCEGECHELRYLALLDEHRGIGLSAQLLGEAISIARKNGKDFLRLGQQPEHPAAKALFACYGFKDGKLCIAPKLED